MPISHSSPEDPEAVVHVPIYMELVQEASKLETVPL
jgi:hypothetical protein